MKRSQVLQDFRFASLASLLFAAAVACVSSPAFARDPEPLQQPASFAVRDHGAKGDGLADDSPALAAAFAAAATSAR